MENSQWEELNHQVCNKYCNVFVTTCHVQETSQNVKPLSVIFQFQLQIHWSLRFYLRYKHKYTVNIVVIEVEIYISSNLWLSFDLRFVITLLVSASSSMSECIVQWNYIFKMGIFNLLRCQRFHLFTNKMKNKKYLIVDTIQKSNKKSWKQRQNKNL
jgi:hypothetical protein